LGATGQNSDWSGAVIRERNIAFALVIPTLNEAENIGTILDRAYAALEASQTSWQILVVDDDSTDGTPAIVAEYSRSHDRVRLVTRRGERGLAGAIAYGWSQTNAALLGVMDADLQHPPEMLPALINEVRRDADIAIASRYLRPGSVDGWNPIRKTLSRISAWASVPVQRPQIRVKDSLSGFFVLRRKCIEGLDFQKTGFKLLLEILARGHVATAREIPFRFSPRMYGDSKADWTTGAHYAFLLWRLSRDSRHRGVVMQGFRPYSDSSFVDKPLPKQPRSLQLILGLLPLVLGVQLIIWCAYLPTALRGDADFRSMYTAGVLVESGRAHQLYNYVLQKRIEDQTISKRPALLPYDHLPYEALLFAMLTLLSYKSAYFCWLGIDLVLAVFCHRHLKRKLWRLDQLWRWLSILFVFGFSPIAAALMQGQDSVLTLLLFTSALVNLEDRRDWAAGLLIGLAFYKFQLVLPMAFLFLTWRKWRVVLGIATSSIATLLISIMLSGWGQLIKYARSMRNLSMALPSGTSVLQIMPVVRMPNLRGMVHAIPHLPPEFALAITVFLSVAVVSVGIWAGRRTSIQWQFAIAVSATTLVGYHVLTHDLSILLISMVVLLDKSDDGGLWIVPIIWLVPLICFFACDCVVPIALILFFVLLVRQASQESAAPLIQPSPTPSSAAIIGSA
jgi:dolichol-phosphate mannosyltransferase